MALIVSEEYNHLPQDYIRECLGLLPHWVQEYNEVGETNLVEFMSNKYYGLSLYKFEGTVLEDGTYRNVAEDEDGTWNEDMKAVAYMNTADGIVYFYDTGGVIGLPTPDGYFVTRMD